MIEFFQKIKIFFQEWQWIHENDPVKKCPDPCCHIDCFLCRSEYCDLRKTWETKKKWEATK